LKSEGLVQYKPLSCKGSKFELKDQPEFINTEIFFNICDEALFLAKAINIIFE
jgi:hypothetical protein